MTLAELNPDEVLAALLDGKVEVQTSATAKHTIKCYADGKQPNKGLADEFVSVLWNGSATSWTEPIGQFEGSLALSVFCKLQTDNTVKKQRVRQILAQVEKLANRISADGFFFNIDPQQVITPTTPNPTTGYSTTTINVEWHTTQND